MKNFKDNIVNFVNGLANIRSARSTNAFVNNERLTDEEARAIYKTGIGSKICQLKAGYALDDTIQFASKEDYEKYKKKLARHVKEVAKYMVGYGRGVLVIIEDDLVKNLAEPLKPNLIGDKTRIVPMSGDMVTTQGADQVNILAKNYNKPTQYTINGQVCHASRVIDFTYFKPSQKEMSLYRYGGISEFERIYEQLIADGIVQRATPSILEKSSTVFYKITGFREALQQRREGEALNFFSALESARSIYGAGVIDAEDDVQTVTQNLSNLAESDSISLRRLAMVTSIPMAILVGENVKGLNSTGDNEMKVFQDMIETLQSDYLLDPIMKLCSLFGIEGIEFKENQGETPTVRAEYDSKIIQNAALLFNMGEDHQAYLEDKGVIQKSDSDAEVDITTLFPEMSEEKEDREEQGE